MKTNKIHTATYLFLLAAVFLVGLGRIAILPPFEGADETAHYARFQATAYPPAAEKDAYFLSKDVADYPRHGPMSPGWVINGARHVHDPLVKKNPEDAPKIYDDYHAFFAKPDKIAAYQKRYDVTPVTKSFTPSPLGNWQYQHPKLYYALFGWLFKRLPALPLRQELLALRTINFLLAFTGFAIGTGATARHLQLTRGDTTVASLSMLYPFLMPSFFMDITRLGNDNLVLFFMGVTWALLLGHLRRPKYEGCTLGLGVALAMACAVKATAIPASIGLIAFLFFYHWTRKTPGGKTFDRMQPALVIGGFVLFFGTCIYLPNLMQGHYPGDSVVNMGGETSIFKKETVLSDYPWAVMSTVTSMVVYFSDWLTFNIYPWKLAFCLTPLVLAGVAYARTRIREKKWATPETLPLWVLSPLAGALVLHGILSLRVYGPITVTPGYYVHQLAPALAFLIGLALQDLLSEYGARKGIADKVVFTLLFLMPLVATAHYMQRHVTLYAGCTGWALTDLQKNLPDVACGPVFMDRLGVIAFPKAAITLFALGFTSAGAGVALLLKNTVFGKKRV